MRDASRRQQIYQLLAYLVLLIPVFLVVRWIFDAEISWIPLTPERVELPLQIIISLVFAALIWTPLFGYQRIDPNTAVIVKSGFSNQIWVYINRSIKPGEPEPKLLENTSIDTSFISIPFVQTVLAVMPDYQFTFEFPIEAIDTQTLKLNRITRIEVRVTCKITDHRSFYFVSAAYFDRIQELVDQKKRQLTDANLWKQLLKEVIRQRIDDGVRDVVWRWHEHIARDPSLVLRASFTLEKPSELDPYDLSVNRGNLARHVLREMQSIAQERGFSLLSLVFEKIEIDPELIKRKTRNKKGEIDEATHDATKEAEAIKAKGSAEAQVRAENLARVLDVLINQERIPLTDPLITQIVRAALYSDGEMIWKGVLEKSATGDGKVKTA